MISELLSKMSRNFLVRIFASDIDDDALNIARKAVYTADSVAEIDSQLVNKYFTQKDTNYHLCKEIREMVVLTHHDLLKYPPFIKMDIISCRNALIYFKSSVQQEIFAMFHYALEEKGILFLGISETASHNMHYFSTINSQWKLYQKEQLSNPPKLPQRFYQTFPLKPTQNSSLPAQETYTNIDEAIAESIYDLLMPSCIVVNKHCELIFTKGEVPYLKFSEGFVSLNLYKNLHPLLHLEVRNIMSESSLTKKAATSKFVELSDVLESKVFVRVLASPFIYQQDEYVTLLYFQDIRSCEMVFESGNFNLPTESDLVVSLETQLA
jgi:two-component system CheB/CheR fusion protein